MREAALRGRLAALGASPARSSKTDSTRPQLSTFSSSETTSSLVSSRTGRRATCPVSSSNGMPCDCPWSESTTKW